MRQPFDNQKLTENEKLIYNAATLIFVALISGHPNEVYESGRAAHMPTRLDSLGSSYLWSKSVKLAREGFDDLIEFRA